MLNVITIPRETLTLTNESVPHPPVLSHLPPPNIVTIPSSDFESPSSFLDVLHSPRLTVLVSFFTYISHFFSVMYNVGGVICKE